MIQADVVVMTYILLYDEYSIQVDVVVMALLSFYMTNIAFKQMW